MDAIPCCKELMCTLCSISFGTIPVDFFSFLISVPPKIDRSSLMSDVKLKTGQDLVLDIKYCGEPEPIVEWTKANQVQFYF